MLTSSPEFSPDSNRPLVSVVMPAYNAERYVASAIQSILEQTLADWELIVVDDGSTDATSRILSELTDPRIHLVTLSANQGLPRALNTGVRAARGRYIARLDADDVALPERLEKQSKFLATHPGIGILGSNATAIDELGKHMWTMWRPTQPAAVKYLALFETPLFHPTVMTRSEVLKSHPYDEKYRRSEDYELWSRLIFDYSIVAENMGEPLILFRQHAKSFTKSIGSIAQDLVVRVTAKNMGRYRRLNAREFNLVTLYRSSSRKRISDVAGFALLTALLTGAFVRQERPSLSAWPAMTRIALGTLWRILRRSVSKAL